MHGSMSCSALQTELVLSKPSNKTKGQLVVITKWVGRVFLSYGGKLVWAKIFMHNHL